jgi:hypothetical protein
MGHCKSRGFYFFCGKGNENYVRTFYANVGRKDIFKPTIENESLHQDNNDSGVRIVNFAT